MRVTFACRGARFDVEGLARKAQEAGERGLARAGEYVRASSVAIMPKRSGVMAASLRVEAAPRRVCVRSGVPYALIQHEHAEFRHPNGGQAGFLRDVIEAPDTAQEVERILEEELRALL